MNGYCDFKFNQENKKINTTEYSVVSFIEGNSYDEDLPKEIYIDDPKLNDLNIQSKINSAVNQQYCKIESSISKIKTKDSQELSFFSFVSDNITDRRMTDEYRKYVNKFDKDFGDDNKEINEVSELLSLRIKRLEEFLKDLSTKSIDMILYKNHLAREISDVCNDLKEANNNILVLMNDRSIIKDRFCLLRMKIKKLKDYNKSFEDDLRR